VGRVWPRHGHCGRPLNSVVRTGTADQFLTFYGREQNNFPTCGTDLDLRLVNPDQWTGVELLVGTRSIFKFCIRLVPTKTTSPNIGLNPPFWIDSTAYISHMSGVGLMDAALGIFPDPSPPASCPGLLGQARKTKGSGVIDRIRVSGFTVQE
jgi:hypothetical protein